MVGFAAVCVYCCFCLLYVLWVAVETVGIYVAKPVVDGYITPVIFGFLYNSVKVLSPVL